MWFGIVFAILVEIVPLSVRSSTVGIFLFVMNNVGGNLPILVDPVSKIIGYRAAVSIFYAGFYGVSSILFFFTMFWMEGKKAETEDNGINISSVAHMRGHENKTFTTDETNLSTINGNRPPISRPLESSKL